MSKNTLSRDEARERAREKIRNSMVMLEQGVIALVDSTRWEQYLKVQARFHRYSFFNTLLILLQKPDATRVAGYNTWRKLGRHVRAGEKGIAILVPYISKAKNKDTVSDDGLTIAPDVGDEDAGARVNETKAVRYFGVSYVFDQTQTDGQDLPEVCMLLQGGDELELNKYVDQIITARGYEVAIVQRVLLRGANGLCDYQGKRISIADDLSPLHHVKTRVHELAHSMIHSEDEYRQHNETSVVELEAESVAYVVLSHFDIDSSGYSFGYLAAWQDGDKDKVSDTLKASGKRIQSAADEIISQIENLLGGAQSELEEIKLPLATEVC